MSVRVIGVCGRKSSGKDEVGRVLVEQYGFVRVALADPIKQLAHLIFGFDTDTLFGPSAAREQRVSHAVARAWWSSALAGVDKHDVQRTIARLFPDPKLASEALRDLVWRTLEPYGGLITARVVLQQMGTEWGRALYENVWVDEVLRVVAALDTGHDYHPMHGVKPRAQPSVNRLEPAIPGVVITDVRFENEVRAVQHYAAGGRVWTINAERRLPPQVMGEHASEPAYADTAAWADTIIDNNGPIEALLPEVERAATSLQLQKVA
jgi:hypothetical protein